VVPPWRTSSEPTGQIKCAVLDREAPIDGLDGRGKDRSEFAGRWARGERLTGRSDWTLAHNCSGDSEGAQPRKRIGEIAEPFAEEYPRLNRVWFIGPYSLRSRVSDTPGKAHRHQRLMPVVAKGFVFETNISCSKPRGVAHRPVLMNPAAIKRDRQCEQYQQP
jgi:hypothetical protein